MPNAVIMPKAGITVESCIISTWEKKVGDTVKIGDILFTYETDKASFECESTAEGTLLEIFYQEGDEVECLVNVCAVGNPGEDCSALRPNGETAPTETAPVEAKAEKAETVSAPVVQATVSTDGKTAVSPRAKKLAERAGVDANLATPTGPNGRIIERDVRTLIDNPVVAAQPETAKSVESVPAVEEYTDVKFSGIRKAISKTMINSLSSMAQLTHNTSFDASNILAYRKQLKASEGDFAGITLGDIILYAVSRTLLNHPDLGKSMYESLEDYAVWLIVAVFCTLQRGTKQRYYRTALLEICEISNFCFHKRYILCLVHFLLRVFLAPLTTE